MRAPLACSLLGLVAVPWFATPAAAAVPVSRAASGHATVPVVIGQGPAVEFVLDTGAEGTAVYAAFAAARGLVAAPGKSEALVGQTGSTTISLVQIPTLALDGRAITGLEAAVLPDRADGVPLAGIVGADVLGRFLVEIDFPRRRFALHDAAALASTLLGPGAFPLAVKLDATRFAHLPVRVGAVEAVAVLDTGARRTRVNWQLARRLGLSPASAALRDAEVIQGATNDPIATKEGVLGDVALGRHIVRGTSLLVVDLPVFGMFGVAGEPAMILGLDLLSELRLLIDYRRSQLWLEAQP